MLAEWTAECTEDAPTIVVPWSDAASGLHFVDLRAEPYDIAEISEADHFPALGRALRSLNATRSPLLTSKCDAWSMDLIATPEHVDTLQLLALDLDTDKEEAHAGFGSYIDLLWRERGLFASAHQQQDRLDKIVRRAQRFDHQEAKLECTLRPAILAQNAALEGYGVTLYLFAIGPDQATALRRWEVALEDVVELLRSREMEVPRTSATIN